MSVSTAAKPNTKGVIWLATFDAQSPTAIRAGSVFVEAETRDAAVRAALPVAQQRYPKQTIVGLTVRKSTAYARRAHLAKETTMGLDSYWVAPCECQEDQTCPKCSIPEFTPPLRLVGGILSGHGAGSFRGKVYADVIEEITGVSLYTEKIEPPVVKHMAAKLRAAAPPNSHEYSEFRDGEWEDLVRMFEAYAARDYALAGWW